MTHRLSNFGRYNTEVLYNEYKWKHDAAHLLT